MSILAIAYSGGLAPLWRELASAREVLFWLLAGGFVWVIGDLFQQYAVKYGGITRGIPLSNTNQLWGLMWGIFVFGELRGSAPGVLTRVVAGSIVMAIGAGVIALSSVTRNEHERWRARASAEGERYGVDPEYTAASVAGQGTGRGHRRTWVDWLIVAGATAILIAFASVARRPQIAVNDVLGSVLAIAMLALLAACGIALWRTTRFA